MLNSAVPDLLLQLCVQGALLLMVQEYMSGGTLKKALSDPETRPQLQWNARSAASRAVPGWNPSCPSALRVGPRRRVGTMQDDTCAH